ncbi:MAG: putative Ig domain-containing protein [Verrucomicrobia bacterium]|nr:putative Ig domain-containing protein [Verrucomicrobiota bacterium]
MKCILPIGVFVLCSVATPGAILTITPSAVTNDFSGKITLTIAGLSPGESAKVEKFSDVNTNGYLDAADLLVASYLLTDGRVPRLGGVRNLNVPGDDDGATNGQIRADLFFPGVEPVLDVIAGDHVFRLSSPSGAFTPTTTPMSIRQKTTPQGVTGQIQAAGSGVPLAGAWVFLLPPDGPALAGTVSDAGGHYTLFCAPGTFRVLALKNGFVSDFNAASVAVLTNQMTSRNVTNAAATRTISGTVTDSASSAGLPGVFVMAQSSSGGFASAFTDNAGVYSIAVTAAAWRVGANSGDLAKLGYVPWDERLDANTTSGSVSNLNIAAPKATALVYGTVEDTLNQPLIGLGVQGSDSGHQYDPRGRSFPTNGAYCVGVLVGDWWINPDDDDLAAHGYFGAGTNVSLSADQAVRVDFHLRQVTVRLAGRVVDNLGAPVANIGFGASEGSGGSVYQETDDDGRFSFGLYGAAWHLRLDRDEAHNRHLFFNEMVVSMTNGEVRSNFVFVAQRADRQITGSVRDSTGLPVGYLNILASGAGYEVSTQTDGNGNYALDVLDGTWCVWPNCGEVVARGFLCDNCVSTTVAGGDRTVDFTLYPPIPLQIVTTSLPDGTLGEPYSTTNHPTLQAIGSYGPFTWLLVPGAPPLPPGLELTSEGLIWGTPTFCGTFSFRVRVTDTAAATAEQAFSITIPFAPLRVTSTSLTNGTVGAAYAATLQAVGCQPPFSWFLVEGSAPLPGGLTLATNGLLSGVPTNAGTFYFMVQASDPAANTAEEVVTLTIDSSVQILTDWLPDGMVGAAYNVQLGAAYGQTPYHWTIVSNALPGGLLLNTNTGVMSGVPGAAGTFNFTVRVTDAALASDLRSLSLTVHPTLRVTTTNLPNATVGVLYNAPLEATGGQPPYAWSKAPGSAPLPAGLDVDPNGFISGTPTNVGTNAFIVRVTDAGSRTANKSLSIAVRAAGSALTIVTTNLPGRQVNLPYSAGLVATGGVPPYTWWIISGHLPPGLGLTVTDGGLGGTPTDIGQFGFTVLVTDNAAHAATQPLSITIHPTPPGVPIAVGMDHEILLGLAGDGTNFLVAFNDSGAWPSNIVAQLVALDGTLLGPQINLGRKGATITIAFDGANYLLVWEDRANPTDTDLYAQFISRTGALVGAAFPVCTAPGAQQLDSRRSLIFDGSNYFLAWRDYRHGNEADVYGQFIAPSGALVGANFPITTDPGNQTSASLDFDGTNYLAVYVTELSDLGFFYYQVWGNVVSRAGVVGTPFPISENISMRAGTTRVTWNGTAFLGVWSQDDGPGYPSPAEWNIYGRVGTMSGFAGSEFLITTNAGQQVIPSIGNVTGDFLVTWLDAFGTTNTAWKGRFFNSLGSQVGPEFTIAPMQGTRVPMGPVVTDGHGLLALASWVVWPYDDDLRGRMADGDIYWQLISLSPRLLPLGFSPRGGFQLRVIGGVAQTYTLQTSTNLTTWTPLVTNSVSGGVFDYEDTTAPGQRQRFYKVIGW